MEHLVKTWSFLEPYEDKGTCNCNLKHVYVFDLSQMADLNMTEWLLSTT